MLKNADFENGFTVRDDVNELSVARDWLPWWDHSDTRPEFHDAIGYTNRIHSGASAQQWKTSYATHTGGIQQLVTGIKPGSILRFSAWVQCWSELKDGSRGKYRMKIGIEPYGLRGSTSQDIVWSNDGHAVQPYDKYQRLEVDTIAKSDRCVVIVWGQAEWEARNNDAYVDDTCLTITENTPEPPPEGLTEERVREIVREESLKLMTQICDELSRSG